MANAPMGKQRSFVGMATLLGIGAVAILYFFPPNEHAFYPRCLFQMLLGIDCPGCGSLRATHQMLHGNIAAAFQLNPFAFLLWPLLGIFLVRAKCLTRRANG